MNTVTFLKGVTIFIGGAFCALFLLSVAYQSQEKNVLGAQTQVPEETDSKIQSSVAKTKQNQLGIVGRVLNSALLVVEQSPLLAPIFKTTGEVTVAVDSVKNLPQDQRAAICQQICGE